MAATAWSFYDSAKKKIGNGTIVLNSGVFKMSLHTSAANVSLQTLSVWSSTNNEIVAQGGYSTAGGSLAGISWTLSGSVCVWDATNKVFTANGANLSNVKYAVIHRSAGASVGARSGHLLCWSRLSTAQFAVTSGNTLTIQFATAGIFTLT